MNLLSLRTSSRLLPLTLLSLVSFSGLGQSKKQFITLDPSTKPVAAEEKAAPASKAPDNFLRMGSLRVGETGDVQTLTLRFAGDTRVQSISGSPDFKIEPGGTCIDGNHYTESSTCTLRVRFTPQGPGRRLGRVAIAHSASVTPSYVGLGGTGYAPTVSFVPALISTVPASLVSGAGLMNGAVNLTVDGGDTLYIADTGNNVIRYLDSSGVIRTASSSSATLSAPTGIGVDEFGDIFFSEPAANQIWEIYNFGSTFVASGSSAPSSPCTYSSPCTLSSTTVASPGQMSVDSNNQLFFAEATAGAAITVMQPEPAHFATLYSPFTYQEATADAFAVDANDTLYSFWGPTSGVLCAIEAQNFYDAVNSNVTIHRVTGGRTCGFSGDGGQARNAEISGAIGQIYFDQVGNMYFSDTKNQRVRRIDATTGIIRTLAGTGTAGYAGDGGMSTIATLNNPAGVAVDTQGQVYILSNSAASGTAQVIRKLGPNGALSFTTGTVRGTSSAPLSLTISNTGNAPLSTTSVVFTGANPSEYKLDPTSTSCNFAAGNSLAVGQSCTVGVIFTPAAAGLRTANLVLLDNTVTNSNSAQLRGIGILPNATVKITAPAPGSSTTAGTSVKFSASVTSASGAAPTGTVTFSVDGATYGSPVTLVSGVASTTLTGLTTKSHTIGVLYNGDSNYATGSASETITVISGSMKGAPIRQSNPMNGQQ